MDEEDDPYFQDFKRKLNHNFEEGEVTEFLCFEDFKARVITVSDDFKNLSEDSFYNLYDVYNQISRLYIHRLLRNVKKKRFYTPVQKVHYISRKENQLTTITINKIKVRFTKIENQLNEMKEILENRHKKRAKKTKKFFNYKIDDKIAMDYLAKIFDKLVLHVPEEKIKKILQESGLSDQ